MNRIEIIGHLGREPEMSYTPNGKAVCKFSVAVSRKWGEQENTTWFNVVAWERLAETCNSYLHKGSKVLLAGRMESRPYTDKEGHKSQWWEITASEMEMLDRKPEGQHNEEAMQDAAAGGSPF